MIGTQQRFGALLSRILCMGVRDAWGLFEVTCSGARAAKREAVAESVRPDRAVVGLRVASDGWRRQQLMRRPVPGEDQPVHVRFVSDLSVFCLLIRLVVLIHFVGSSNLEGHDTVSA